MLISVQWYTNASGGHETWISFSISSDPLQDEEPRSSSIYLTEIEALTLWRIHWQSKDFTIILITYIGTKVNEDHLHLVIRDKRWVYDLELNVVLSNPNKI